MTDTISCCDACGTPPIPKNEVDLHGWQRLPLTGRTRCLACHRALEAVNGRSAERQAVTDWNAASEERFPIDMSRPRTIGDNT